MLCNHSKQQTSRTGNYTTCVKSRLVRVSNQIGSIASSHSNRYHSISCSLRKFHERHEAAYKTRIIAMKMRSSCRLRDARQSDCYQRIVSGIVFSLKSTGSHRSRPQSAQHTFDEQFHYFVEFLRCNPNCESQSHWLQLRQFETSEVSCATLPLHTSATVSDHLERSV